MTTLQSFAKIAIGTSSIFCLQLFVLNQLSGGQTAAAASERSPQAAIATSESQSKSERKFPNTDGSVPRSSRGAGSRGCENSDLTETNLVTLLIPSEEQIGQIASGHPTFFWQLSKSLTVPVEFTLAKQGMPEPIYKVRIDSPAAGLNAVKLPEDRSELTSDGRYMWSVTLVCNAKRPSANPLFFGWVERVAPTQELQQNLAVATTARDRAAAYAQTGLWYDALEVLAGVPQSSPDYAAAQAYFQELLVNAGLTQ